MSIPAVDKILVALKAMIDRKVTSHCWQDVGCYESYGCQLRQLTESIVSSRFQVVLIATFVNSDNWREACLSGFRLLWKLRFPIRVVGRKHVVSQVSGSSESYGFQLRQAIENKSFKSTPTIISAQLR